MPRRVYVTDKEIIRKRGVHTVYVGDKDHPNTEGSKILSTKFVAGVAYNVDEGRFQRMKDLGHASESKPRTHDDE